jgi:hypothetical protein
VAALQGVVANHRKVRRLRVEVLSVAVKGETLILSGVGQEGERERTPDEVSKCFDDIGTEDCRRLRDEAWGSPVYCPGGVRHEGSASLARALVRNMGTCRPDMVASSTGCGFAPLAGKGRTPSRGNGEGESTVAGNRDGPSCSSGDGPVMGLERRRRVIRAGSLVNCFRVG